MFESILWEFYNIFFSLNGCGGGGGGADESTITKIDKLTDDFKAAEQVGSEQVASEQAGSEQVASEKEAPVAAAEEVAPAAPAEEVAPAEEAAPVAAAAPAGEQVGSEQVASEQAASKAEAAEKEAAAAAEAAAAETEAPVAAAAAAPAEEAAAEKEAAPAGEGEGETDKAENILCLPLKIGVTVVEEVGGKKYIFNDSDATKYGVGLNQLYLLNSIPKNHPMAILNININVTGEKSKKFSTTVDGFGDDPFDFYWGDIRVKFNEGFDTAKVYCYYHGPMGGIELKYVEYCEISPETI